MRWSLCALLAAPALLTAQEVERFRLTGQHVAIYNLAGEVTLTAGAGDAVLVEVRRGGDDADRLDIAHGPLDGRETLRVRYPADRIQYRAPGAHRTRTEMRVREDGTFSDRHWTGEGRERGRRVRISDGDGLDAHATLLIRVPPGRRVALYVGLGPVTVERVSGQLRVDGAASSVSAVGTRGELVVDVGSGSVEVTDADGHVDIDTGSGAVTVRDVRGDVLRVDTGSGSVDVARVTVRHLHVDTGSGGVRIEDAAGEEVRIDTGSGSVHAGLSGGLRDVEVDTGSGSVTLVVPPSYGARVDLESGSGGIELDFPLATSRVERHHVRGTIGDGAARLKVDTGSGRITIRRGGR